MPRSSKLGTIRSIFFAVGRDSVGQLTPNRPAESLSCAIVTSVSAPDHALFKAGIRIRDTECRLLRTQVMSVSNGLVTSLQKALHSRRALLFSIFSGLFRLRKQNR